MITEKDLQEAIAECQGVKRPNAETCIMLAAFYTIKQNMFPEKKEEQEQSYSYSMPSTQVETEIDYYSDTEFGKKIDGKNAFDVWEIMDELMTAIQVLNPPLYNNVIKRL